MSGEGQRARFLRAHRDPVGLPEDRFEYVSPKSGRVQCRLCHRDGWGSVAPLRNYRTFTGAKVRWDQAMNPWQIDCLVPHDWPCQCGLTFPSFRNLWAHIGADRPAGWGRQGVHGYALECELA